MAISWRDYNLPDDARVSCGNCRWEGRAAKLNEAKDILERIEAGGTVPAGECPECGSLAYIVKEPEVVCIHNEGGLTQRVHLDDGSPASYRVFDHDRGVDSDFHDTGIQRDSGPCPYPHEAPHETDST